MIVGTKAAWDSFLSRHKDDDKDRVNVIKDMMVWVSDDAWYIEQPNDGPFERSCLVELEMTGKINEDWLGENDTLDKSFHPVHRKRQIEVTNKTADASPVRQAMPPAKKPPHIFSKVASYWKAITGDKVSDDVMKKRMEQCTEKGGYTYSPVNGTVMEFGPDTEETLCIHIHDADNKLHIVKLPTDEMPKVQVGDEVVVGQIIADGPSKKPCPYLVKDNTDPNQIYCGACSCGIRKQAELHNKLYYKELQCPRTPPLFTSISVDGKAV